MKATALIVSVLQLVPKKYHKEGKEAWGDGSVLV